MQSTKIEVDTSKLILASFGQIYKTENFIKQTKFLQKIDFFISKIAESVQKYVDFSIFHAQNQKSCLIETFDGTYKFLIKFGSQLGSNFSQKDIVFCKFIFDDSKLKQNDLRLVNFLSAHEKFSVYLKIVSNDTKPDDFKKIYIVPTCTNINFPLLSESQKQIVEIQDKNVLVQGVAGSGKTNVCIDKLIWTSCRNYSGKVLYTTFSRGLLVNTKLKVELFKAELQNYLAKYSSGKVEFLDDNHKKALENKFGIYFFSDDDNKINEKIQRIIDFLDTHVNYYLIEDLFKNNINKNAKFVDEHFFTHKYLPSIKNHQLSKDLKKLEQYSSEILYKEIFGMIYGFYDFKTNSMLTKNEYVLLRQDSFSKQDCELIFNVAVDYQKFLTFHNLFDNNSASRVMLDNISNLTKYSLVIADEVQDFSQINLVLFKKMALKVFCVGDALQMINPSYFSFSYLKNLLYDGQTRFVELKNNYRNTKKLEEIIDALGTINTELFGTHSFVLKGESVESALKTNAIFVPDENFVKMIAKGKYDNFTFVVASQKQKEVLRNFIKNQEILTVSEIKGLERDTVVLLNILSDNLDKWNKLERLNLSHKTADENSVFRYYFNLFYVGISRAKQNLFIVEKSQPKMFNQFLTSEFTRQNSVEAIKTLDSIISKVEFTLQEYLDRVKEFINLEQYDNARFTASKIPDDTIRVQELNKIEVAEKFIKHGNYHEAGIRFWEYGMIEQAKEQFLLSHDEKLIELIDACASSNDSNLSIDILKYFNDVKNSPVARDFILQVVNKDLKNLKDEFGGLNKKFKTLKEKKHG